jgi:hypothetical protein
LSSSIIIAPPSNIAVVAARKVSRAIIAMIDDFSKTLKAIRNMLRMQISTADPIVSAAL